MSKFFNVTFFIGLTLLTLFLFGCSSVSSPQKIQWNEADKHIGENVIVSGKVSRTYIAKFTETKVMNIYINDPASARNEFIITQVSPIAEDEKITALKNDEIEVEGKIKNYTKYRNGAYDLRNSYAIEITDFNQIKVIKENE